MVLDHRVLILYQTSTPRYKEPTDTPKNVKSVGWNFLN